eukprot:TRINITY_DN1838_c0_g2_i1.p1 TRINITY_DN1838_c0_g2~~TRINITY_DN1838_c0_g2_i1.p1  ORF type:complete len:1186 (+),score=422.72 TRINITY_DN1838_c0_g2_i1:104-3559(+)
MLPPPRGPPPPLPAQPQHRRPPTQQEQILAQNVEQAIHHVVDATRNVGGRPPVLHSSAGNEAVSADAPLAQAGLPGQQTLQQRGAPRAAVEQGDPVLLARAPADAAAADGGAVPPRGFKLEFTAGQLAFATDIALLFVCCSLPIAALCGTHLLSILLVGVIAMYIFDYTNNPMMTLCTIWATIGAVWLGLYLMNVHLLWSTPLTIMVLLNVSLVLTLAGVFATVQFRWFQLDSPELALIGERALLGVTPLACLPCLFSTVVTMVGVNFAPFVFALVMVLLHKRFYRLRNSSFKQALDPHVADEQRANGRLEAACSCLLTLFLPCVLHVAISHPSGVTALSVLDSMALLGLPVTLLFYDCQGSFWFMYKRPDAEGDKGDIWGLGSVRVPAMICGYLGFLHCFLYRIVMGRYGHLFAGVAPPLNVILITLGAYALSATVVCAVQLVEMEDRKLGWAVALRWVGVLFLSIVGSVAVAFAVGMPRFMLPFSALSAACLTAYCLDRKNLNNYLLFSIGTCLMLMWWMFKSFSFLLVELPVLGGTQSVSLPKLSVYIVWLYMQELVIFPCGFSRSTGIFHAALVVHALCFTAVEHILYSQPESVYPFIAVAFTTVWGMKVAERLVSNQKLSKGQGSLLAGLYVAKLYLYILCATQPDQSSEYYSRPFKAGELVAAYLGTAFMASAVVQLMAERRDKKRRAQSGGFWVCYCIASAVVAFFSRDNVLLAVLELTTGNSTAQSGRLFGLVLMFAGALQMPLTSLLPPSQGRVTRVAAGLLCAGALLALMDPVLEGEAEEAPELDVWQPERWATWLAVVSVAGVAATLTNAVQLPDSTAARMAWWGTLSTTAGFSFAQLYLPFATWHTGLLFALIFVLLTLCVDFCHFSENAQYEDSNTVTGLYTALLLSLLAALLDGQWRFPEGFDEPMKWEAAMQRQSAILSLNAGMNIVLATLMKLKLLENPIFLPRSISKIDSLRGNMGQGTHFGLLCNICAVQAYLSLLILSSNVGGHGASNCVLLSTLLLLMHDDGWFMVGLADSEQLVRWAPPMLAALAGLGWQVCWYEIPMLLDRAPLLFAVQLTIYLIALGLGIIALKELWTDAHRRRRDGSTDPYVIGVGMVMLLGATTPGVRWTVGVTVLGTALPVYADSFWARKLSAYV